MSSQSGDASTRPIVIALAGALALAVAMGVGRFAFTPLLPMMLRDGSVDLPGASWLASANYLGYLVGALFCTVQPWLQMRMRGWPRLADTTQARAGLIAVVLLTLGMALPWPATWPTLRFAAGIASAVVLVSTTGWGLAQLARQGAGRLGGVIFTGPGLGIVASGLLVSALVHRHRHASMGWAISALLALVLTVAVWRFLQPAGRPLPADRNPAAAGSSRSGASAAVEVEKDRPARSTRGGTTRQGANDATLGGDAAGNTTAGSRTAGNAEVACLAVAYGLAGFGYIVTATFLPVIARTTLPASPWLDLFWPIFGAGVVAGSLLATRLTGFGDLRWVLAGCYAVQAAGIGIGLASPSLAGFAIGSLLLGLPFTVISLFAMQEVRRLRPHTAPAGIGLLTAVYGVGQIAGPLMTDAVLRHGASTGGIAGAAAGFNLALEIAMASLLLGALLYGGMMRSFPLRLSRRSA